jgi:sterol desaturase/sphingolipid hydroxylase (fatty acid hydroxylase superfamily)
MLLTSVVLITAYVAVWAAERVPALRFRREAWFRRYATTDLAWFVVALSAAAFTARVFRPELQRVRLGLVATAFAALPGWSRFVLAIALYDFVAFTIHVAIHRSEVLWNIHKVHHSSLELDGLATTRTHTMELFLRNIPAQLALSAVGTSPRLVGGAVLTYGLFALLGHSNLALPTKRLEVLFVTPRLHRLHHVPETTQKNFGTIFSIWDHICGHLVRRDESPLALTGVPGEILSYPQRFVPALRAPFRAMAASGRGRT